MRRMLIPLLLALFAVNASAAPEIKFEALDQSFGVVEGGKNAELEFRFSNIGDETLVITQLRANCVCLSPKLEKENFSPGESGVIRAEFRSQQLRGRILKDIIVYSNDPIHTYTRLRVVGTINIGNVAFMELNTQWLDFGRAQSKKEYTKTVKIKNTGTINLRLLKITHGPQVITVFSKSTIKPNEEAELKVVFTPMEEGRFSDFIMIRSNSYSQKMSFVRITAEIKD